MTTSSTFGTNPLGYEGIDLNSVANVLTPANRIPTTNDVQPYGTIWPYIGTSPATLYISEGAGNWGLYTIPSGDLVSLSGDAGTATPSANNIILSGGSTGLTTSGSGHTVALTGTLNVAHGGIGDATLTAHGVLLGEGTSGITSLAAAATGSTLMGSTGADPAFTGSPSFSGSVTAATGVIATTGGLTASAGGLTVTLGGASITGTTNINTSGAGVTSINTGGTGVLNLGNATGNTSVTGSLSTTTTLTATLGNITATNGNFVLTAAGNKMIRTSVATNTTAGANSIGTVTLVGGTATISTTAVTASSLIKIWRQSIGSTGAAALGELSIGTIVASTSFVINACSATVATSLATTDVSVVGWEIVN